MNLIYNIVICKLTWTNKKSVLDWNLEVVCCSQKLLVGYKLHKDVWTSFFISHFREEIRKKEMNFSIS